MSGRIMLQRMLFTTCWRGIDLSLDGKIIMECYGSIMSYFTSVLRDRYRKYALSKSLYVTISG